MQEIPLENVPNQKFSITLDETRYTIRLTTINGITYADIDRDDVNIISGFKCCPFQLIMPYPSMDSGNFLFETSDGEYPQYESFGDTQFLYYLTQEEVEVFRGA